MRRDAFAIVSLVLPEFGNQRTDVFLYHPVDVDELFVDIGDVGILRLQGEEERTAANERLDVAIVLLGPAPEELFDQLSFAASPFQEWFAHLWFLSPFARIT